MLSTAFPKTQKISLIDSYFSFINQFRGIETWNLLMSDKSFEKAYLKRSHYGDSSLRTLVDTTSGVLNLNVKDILLEFTTFRNLKN